MFKQHDTIYYKQKKSFFWQSVFGQLINLIDNSAIVNSVKKYHLDRYVKRFTTISLFQDILKCVGRKPNNGKRKREIKVHAIINGLVHSFGKQRPPFA